MSILLVIFYFFSVHAAPETTPNCSDLAEKFCEELYSPKKRGNWDLSSGEKLRFGDLPSGDSYVNYFYVRAVLEGKKYLPADLRKALESRNYFSKLQRLFDLMPKDRKTPATRIKAIDLANEVNALFAASLSQTGLLRMEKRHPGFSKILYRSPALNLESQQVERDLNQEFFSAIWDHTKQWKQIQSSFTLIKDHFLQFISEQKNVDAETRAIWKERIQKVRLISPGTSISTLNSPNCPNNEVNARYFGTLNQLTVCAGFFNSGNPLMVIAHELAHALGPTRVLIEALESTPIEKRFKALQNQVCENQEISCEKWESFKADYSKEIEKIPALNFGPQKYLTCLQEGKKKVKDLDSKLLETTANRKSSRSVDYYATYNSWLELAAIKSTTPDGIKHANTSYLNPCKKNSYDLLYSQTHAFYYDKPLFFPFVLEYRCSKIKSDSERFEHSVEAAKSMDKKYYLKQLNLMGRYGGDPDLKTEGYTSEIDEWLADSLGTQIAARILSEEKNLEKRREKFFAAIAGYACERPSFEKDYPEIATAQKKFSSEPHSQIKTRQLEIMTKPIQEQLQCRLPQQRECSL